MTYDAAYTPCTELDAATYKEIKKGNFLRNNVGYNGRGGRGTVILREYSNSAVLLFSSTTAGQGCLIEGSYGDRSCARNVVQIFCCAAFAAGEENYFWPCRTSSRFHVQQNMTFSCLYVFARRGFKIASNIRNVS